MKIIVDSAEYRSWHELGHAVVCLHLGGDVDLVEFLDDDPRGHARTQCVVTSEIENSVACGGFAAEFVLLDRGHAEQSPDDTRNISQVVFHNATGDREDFWGRRLVGGDCFTPSEDEAFMIHAITVAAPILELYLPALQQLARELAQLRRVDGRRIKEVLRNGGGTQ
jgi:hypothetical protein